MIVGLGLLGHKSAYDSFDSLPRNRCLYNLCLRPGFLVVINLFGFLRRSVTFAVSVTRDSSSGVCSEPWVYCLAASIFHRDWSLFELCFAIWDFNMVILLRGLVERRFHYCDREAGVLVLCWVFFFLFRFTSLAIRSELRSDPEQLQNHHLVWAF